MDPDCRPRGSQVLLRPLIDLRLFNDAALFGSRNLKKGEKISAFFPIRVLLPYNHMKRLRVH